MPGRSTTPPTSAWAKLASALPTPRAKLGLSRFMRFCTDHAIRPEDVNDAVFDRFRAALQTDSVVTTLHRVHRTACDQWNKAAQTVPSWPATRVRLPQNERRYSFDWSDFPASFVSDVEAFLSRSRSGDPFADDYVRPQQRHSTIHLQRAQIRQMASLLVHSGVPIEQITRLSVLAEPATAKTILRAAHNRLGDRAQHLHGMALLLKVIAAHWSNATSEVAGKLARFASQAAPTSRGMTARTDSDCGNSIARTTFGRCSTCRGARSGPSSKRANATGPRPCAPSTRWRSSFLSRCRCASPTWPRSI
jgi:hypothetical protein